MAPVASVAITPAVAIAPCHMAWTIEEPSAPPASSVLDLPLEALTPAAFNKSLG
jgi:hypothetical protein